MQILSSTLFRNHSVTLHIINEHPPSKLNEIHLDGSDINFFDLFSPKNIRCCFLYCFRFNCNLDFVFPEAY
jgi:hypothetical protein